MINLDGARIKLNDEQKEVGRDVVNVIISYTPLSGIFDTAKFVHKWLYKRRVVQRMSSSIRRWRKRARMKEMAGR